MALTIWKKYTSTLFTNYGRQVQLQVTSTEMSERHPSQGIPEQRMLLDVMHKLNTQLDDGDFDVGCGVGPLAGRLSYAVDSVTGVNYPDALDVVRTR